MEISGSMHVNPNFMHVTPKFMHAIPNLKQCMENLIPCMEPVRESHTIEQRGTCTELVILGRHRQHVLRMRMGFPFSSHALKWDFTSICFSLVCALTLAGCKEVHVQVAQTSPKPQTINFLSKGGV